MSKEFSDIERIAQLKASFGEIKNELRKVIVGQDETIENLMVSLFAKGHCLLIGVPGLAKTLLIKTLADIIDLKFNRIQFTPDLMPGDISGSEVLEDNVSTGQKNFRFIKGPIFANIVLADEINRTPPKTQAALLEAMEEHHVTNAGETYFLDEPFYVLATQNPIEQEGTYPLPEAQLDRFMFNVWLDYPSEKEEFDIVQSTTSDSTPELKKILNGNDIIAFQKLVRRVPVSDHIINYAVKLVRSTRPETTTHELVKNYISYGAGPRASQYLILGAKSRAALHGRFTPNEDDVNSVAIPVLRHRIVMNFNAEAENVSVSQLITTLIEKLRVK
ncbi:MAG: AAA family ATPase [bacterium]